MRAVCMLPSRMSSCMISMCECVMMYNKWMNGCIKYIVALDDYLSSLLLLFHDPDVIVCKCVLWLGN